VIFSDKKKWNLKGNDGYVVFEERKQISIPLILISAAVLG
jgi:hypothetical protein